MRVSGAPPQLETANASLGSVLDSRRILDLPLTDGNPFMLSRLAPGVLSLGSIKNQKTFDGDATSDLSANGVAVRRNEFQLDGVPDTAGRIVAFIPSTEMISEFKVQTASYDAAYGNTPGAIVNVSLKSGTNQLHGSLWENLRNSATDANQFFTNRAGQGKPPFRLNHFGASAGGPVYLPKLYDGRNKTFFFFGYEGLKDAYPQPFSGTVPTAKMRSGDLSELLALGSRYQVYDPGTIRAAAGGRYSRDPLPGNLIPAGRLNATAKAYLQYWPEPNIAGTSDFQQNYYNGRRMKTDDFFSNLVRIDHNIGQSHRLFFRVNQNSLHEVANNNFNNLATGTNRYRVNRGAALDDVWVVSPSTVVGMRYGYTRWAERRPALSDGFDLATLGFAPAWANARSADIRTMPPLSVAGMASLGGTWGYKEAYDTHTFAGNVTKIIGPHSLRFGVDCPGLPGDPARRGQCGRRVQLRVHLDPRPARQFGRRAHRAGLRQLPVRTAGRRQRRHQRQLRRAERHVLAIRPGRLEDHPQADAEPGRALRPRDRPSPNATTARCAASTSTPPARWKRRPRRLTRSRRFPKCRWPILAPVAAFCSPAPAEIRDSSGKRTGTTSSRGSALPTSWQGPPRCAAATAFSTTSSACASAPSTSSRPATASAPRWSPRSTRGRPSSRT